jgi:hypothetical protein
MRFVILSVVILAVSGWVFWSATIAIAHAKLKKDHAELKERMQGLKEPVLWLPERERQEHARKLLKREQDQYEELKMERLSNYMKGENEIK